MKEIVLKNCLKNLQVLHQKLVLCQVELLHLLLVFHSPNDLELKDVQLHLYLKEVFPNEKIRLHWNIKDPFHGWGNEQRDLPPYRIARDELKKRIDKFLSSKNIDPL